MKDTLIEIVDSARIPPEDDLIVLYATYITRTWKEVEAVWQFHISLQSTSTLCCYKALTHPYMCVDGDGKPFIPNNIYRRQELPAAYEYSHYVAILKVCMLPEVNQQLIHPTTSFYKLVNKPVNIDGPDDLCMWSTENKL